MHANAKMRPVETISGRGRGRIKEIMAEVNSIIIYCKNFYKCHIVLPVQQ
jgi:hypothetical protein